MMSMSSLVGACSHLRAWSHLWTPQSWPVVDQPAGDLPPIGHCASVHQQILEEYQVDEGVHQVGVVQVLPLHGGEEEELGDCVEADEDGQEGAKEEVFEADAPPDVEADHPSEGDVDEDHHGGDEHEH